MSDLYKLPKIVIAFVVIIGTIAFVLISDPPHTFCDTQLEHFKTNQKGIIYKDSKDYHKIKSAIKRTKQICKTKNSSGGCYDYFFYLKKVLKDLRLLSNECKAQIFIDSKVKKTLEDALILMPTLAWRENVLFNRVSKFNWLKQSDLALFCDIKKNYILEYGRNKYQILEKKILNTLPTKSKNKNLILKKSILSESCLKYQI